MMRTSGLMGRTMLRAAAAVLALGAGVRAGGLFDWDPRGEGLIREQYMRKVHGGGSGPDYAYLMGKYEITVAQFVTFLNDAEANQGNPRGANLVFRANGDVGIANSTWIDCVIDLSDNNNANFSNGLAYDAGMPAGSRYSFDPQRADHPIVAVSWIGAVKFCNWLTLDQGMPLEARCYREGPNENDWAPVTAGNWGVRDLNDDERRALVRNQRGYRLFMDNLPLTAEGYLSDQVNEFNEWYKAAAYDVNGPQTARQVLAYDGGPVYTVPAYHWVFGFGRDELAGADANYRFSGDPYESGTTPIGFYDGVNMLADGTTPTQAGGNPYGIEDLCGNVVEWGQDYVKLPSLRCVRGGTWEVAGYVGSAAYRSRTAPVYTFAKTGFRVVQVPEPVAGDINRDGRVDLNDFATLIVCFGLSGPDESGCGAESFADSDLTGDESIGLDDFATLSVNFGQR